MTTYVGARIKRREDPRLLRGEGRYIADISLPGMVHCAVLRSPHAHALIKNINVSAARSLPGVVAVLTAQELAGIGPLPLHVPSPFLDAEMPLPLALDEVVHVGQAVVIVAAETRAIAEDTLESIEVEYQVLEAVIDPEQALADGAAVAHRHRATNLAAHVRQEVGHVNGAFDRADHIIQAEFSLGRVSGQPLETRGILATYEPWRDRERLHVWATTQVPHAMQHILCEMLDLPKDQVRVTAPDVGGGFGIKEIFYPEDVLIPILALRLGCPVRWIEDRVEHFSAAVHERQQHHHAELALDGAGKILGVRVSFVNDNGAFTPWGIVVPMLTAQTIPGPYRVPNYRFDMYCVYTNKTPLAPYRGAGRPQGTYVMERLLDLAAQRLCLDRAEIRFRNVVQPDEFPYVVGLPGRDGRQLTYDSGDYPGTLRQALDIAGYEDALVDLPLKRAEGRHIGIGIGCYVEYAAPGPFEGARVTVEPNGKVLVESGLTNQGQGHPTSLAQLCADRLGARLEDVEIREGDTALLPYGMGTFASRGAAMGGNAIAQAALKVRSKALHLAGELLEVGIEDLEVVAGTIRVKGVPDRSYALGKLAAILESPVPGQPLPAGLDPGLTATEYYHSQGLTYANGTHVAMVEVDPATGQVKILRYVVVHDCGKVLNPLILDGQICGGVAQGIGNALYEEVLYDAGGQLMTTTYLDYLIPSMTEVPDIEVGHRETPSPFNPEGIKGAGEGGAIPVPAVIASAVDDALSIFGIHTNRVPITPAYLRSLLREKL
ncbi:MAG: xanthine dehydrogenase family protein molybdopterin-binding subunit [Chloroflexota bacterium]|nr:xanthine dehydrogenase family protein molybdopterin-binding subunit [Chloroflexota bacterium]